METVGTGFSTSLDAFIAGPEGEVGPLFDWNFGGQTEYRVPSGGITLKGSPQSAELLRKSHVAMGALVVGRIHFDDAGGGAAGTPWTYQFSSLPIGSQKNGSTKDRRSSSSRTASKAPSSKRA